MKNLAGFNKNNRKNICFPLITSATRPIPHSDEQSIPIFKQLLDIPVSVESVAKDPESEFDNEFIDFDNDADFAGYSGEPNRYN